MHHHHSNYRLGATLDRQGGVAGCHFAVRAPLATRVTLCLFDGEESNEKRLPMQVDNGIWHIWVAGIATGQCYGFRADGPSTVQQSFNPQKLLLDPYGKSTVGKPLLATDDDYARFLLNNRCDNGTYAPKSQVICDDFDWDDDVPPHTPWEQTIIYELHVKGFTRLNPDIAMNLRGSYAGLASPAAIAYLHRLGITAVELMPIAYGIDEPHLQRKGLTNYWNYNTLSAFSVERDYWSGCDGTTPLSEFKQAVKALHAAGIEVILDVVFNHSAEAEHDHPIFCQRGLANADFYWLDDKGHCINTTGCGNTINAANTATQQWIIDCLCYWVDSCHVDGFRFDLGVVLGRELQSNEPRFNTRAKLLKRIAAEPLLDGIKLIVEPWDIGTNGYQLGHFPPPFAEWNDRFRDDMRNFFLCQDGRIDRFSQRLAGSSDIFHNNEQYPCAGINFITAHDGFTLADLLAYNDKHNQANGEGNRDGHNYNFSDNHGVEGDSDDTGIQSIRQHSQHALLSALLLSNGTPMLLAGDEIGHSQGGNNNAYCQDNAVTWLNWQQADWDLFAFTRQLIQLRRRIPSLLNARWWTGDNVTWLTTEGSAMQVSDWQDNHIKALQVLLDDQFLLLINGKRSEQTFTVPKGNWRTAKDRRYAVQGAITVQHLSITTLTKEPDHE